VVNPRNNGSDHSRKGKKQDWLAEKIEFELVVVFRQRSGPVFAVIALFWGQRITWRKSDNRTDMNAARPDGNQEVIRPRG
jgi:hypothetical protein